MTTQTAPSSFRRGAAAAEIFQVLRDEILTLQLVSGHPLDEMSLSKRFRVSRSPESRNPDRPRHIHVKYLDNTDRVDVMRDQHHDFVDANEAQDVAAADAIAHSHAMQVLERFLKALRHSPDPSFDLGLVIGPRS